MMAQAFPLEMWDSLGSRFCTNGRNDSEVVAKQGNPQPVALGKLVRCLLRPGTMAEGSPLN